MGGHEAAEQRISTVLTKPIGVDADPIRGKESYYYVRVVQMDGQIAWSSPIWVTLRG